MSALGGPKQTGGVQSPPTAIGIVLSIVLIVVALGLAYFLVQMAGVLALVGIIIGGVLVAFGVHFVPVGGAPPLQWDNRPVSRPVSRCSQPVPALPVSSAAHGLLRSDSLSPSRAVRSAAVS